jgi:phosphoesterase RecJ-like protein
MREISVPGDFLPIYLDTSNPERTLRVVGMPERSAVNIDHHGDNARFASVNFVDPSAGATAELAWEILARLGKPVETSSAIGLYAGLVTDTGRFGYSCTTPRSHRIAAELLEKGIQPELMDRLLYSNWTPQALRLRGRAFSRLDYEPERGIALTWLTRSDFEDTGADLSETEGLASDLLRIRNSRFSAVLIENETSVRVSLRSRGKISAAEVAHRHGGGGHPNAAGMRLPLPLEASLAALKAEILNDND